MGCLNNDHVARRRKARVISAQASNCGESEIDRIGVDPARRRHELAQKQHRADDGHERRPDNPRPHFDSLRSRVNLRL